MVKQKISVTLSYLKFFLLKISGKRPVKIYYWNSRLNFGDVISVNILKNFGYSPIWFPRNRAKLYCTGSILEYVDSNYSGVILGSGAITSETRNNFPNAKIIALRGKKTKRNLGINEDIALGDPGILASELLSKREDKIFDIGIIPHYSDLNNQIIDSLIKKYDEKVCIIDPQDYPLNVLQKMDRCKFIFSSSLHGLICADSLGIPNRWFKITHLVGGEFKFNDYYSLFDKTEEPLLFDGTEDLYALKENNSLPNSKKIFELKKGLKRAFEELKYLV